MKIKFHFGKFNYFVCKKELRVEKKLDFRFSVTSICPLKSF